MMHMPRSSGRWPDGVAQAGSVPGPPDPPPTKGVGPRPLGRNVRHSLAPGIYRRWAKSALALPDPTTPRAIRPIPLTAQALTRFILASAPFAPSSRGSAPLASHPHAAFGRQRANSELPPEPPEKTPQKNICEEIEKALSLG